MYGLSFIATNSFPYQCVLVTTPNHLGLEVGKMLVEGERKVVQSISSCQVREESPLLQIEHHHLINFKNKKSIVEPSKCKTSYSISQ